MADETDNPPPPNLMLKRSKPNQEGPQHGPDLVLRLLNVDAIKLGLSHPLIIEFEKLEHITFNADKVEHLYIICASIFDVENSMLTLTHISSSDIS
jgi:hypothetical protein